MHHYSTKIEFQAVFFSFSEFEDVDYKHYKSKNPDAALSTQAIAFTTFQVLQKIPTKNATRAHQRSDPRLVANRLSNKTLRSAKQELYVSRPRIPIEPAIITAMSRLTFITRNANRNLARLSHQFYFSL